jgi:lysyl-tRNA synthetase class 2
VLPTVGALARQNGSVTLTQLPVAPRRPHAKAVSTDWRRHVPRVGAVVYGLVSIFCLVTALVPDLRTAALPIRTFLEYFFISAAPNLAWAALLAIVASSLRKRKRVAWWYVVLWHSLVALVAIPASVVDPELIPNAIFAVLVLGAMLVSRREFYAKVTKGSALWALITLIILMTLSVVAGFLIVETLHGTLTSGSRLPYAVSQVIGGAATVTGNPPHIVAFFLALFGALSYLAAAWVLVRPRRKHDRLSVDDEVQIRALLAEYGARDSLGYFATRRDKSVLFSPSGKAAIAYRVQNGVSLASGDPIGDPEAWPGAIDAWIDEAREFAWAPAVVGASEEGAEVFTRSGLSALTIGDEAIVEFADYGLDGRTMRVVRQAVRRVERAGYQGRVRRHSEIPTKQMAEVVAAADAWRDTETERGFSMALGRLGDVADGECVLVEAIDDNGALRALLSLSPWGERGVSLDLMRRDRTADNGLMEFMVTELIAAGPRLGIERVSLNFAVMRSIFEEGERIGAGPFIRASRGMLLFLSRFWQLESLYRANAKYQPDWVPRLICFDAAGDLPRVLIAAARAEGFLTTRSPLAVLRRGGSAADATTSIGAQVLAALSECEPKTITEATAPTAPEQDLVRLAKLLRIRATGQDPFGVSFHRTTTTADLRTAQAHLTPDTRTGLEVKIAGRVMRNRIGGGLSFASLRDGSGDLQIMLAAEVLGADSLATWKSDIDLGDQVGVTGEVVTARSGELSVLVTEWSLLGKCLHPLPDKHKGLTDSEARVRSRYLDLIVNPDSRDLLRLRAGVARSIRESLWDRGFIEVETPMLQPIHGGANARPFVTRSNAYDLRLYLRIAPELYLKRLLVGGVEKVFELNRNFRNEGVDSTHNPEFTSLEMYEAYGDYHTMRELTRDLIIEAATNVLGTTRIVRTGHDGRKREIELANEWQVIDVCAGISAALGEEINVHTDGDTLRRWCATVGLTAQDGESTGHLIERLYAETCERHTVEPTFWRDFPRSTSPLTRAKPGSPELAERWDLVAFGAELGTAYTELTDPLDQRIRLTEQSLLAAAGDAEAMELDEDFLRALEFAMPPAGGQGMGIDRLVMFLTGYGIRDTILFPLTRPES